MMDPTTVDRLISGDHVCWAFDDDTEHLTAVARFVQAGLARHQKVMYLTGAAPPPTFRDALSRVGAAPEAQADNHQVQINLVSDLPLNLLDTSRLLDHWTHAITEAHVEGYAGLRVATDMSWAAASLPDLYPLVQYEAQASRLFADDYATMVCFYDRRLFSSTSLNCIGSAHPGSSEITAGAPEAWQPLLRMRRTSDPPGLALSGEADLSNRYALAATIAHLPEDVASEAPLVIDLSDLTFADVGTMRLFVQVAEASATGLRLVGCSPPLLRMLRLLDVRQVIQFDDDVSR